MPVTLAQVLKSADVIFDDWANDKKKIDRESRENESDYFRRLISALDLSRNEQYFELLSDLRDLAVSGACCCIDTVRDEHLKGLSAFRKNDYSRAAERFTEALAFTDERALDSNTLTAELYNSRALCLIWLGHQGHAVADCNLALQYTPSSDTAHFRKAVALNKLGRLHEAIPHARNALEISQSSGAHNAGQDAARLLQDMQEGVALSTIKASGEPQPHTSTCSALPVLEVKQTASEGRALALADHQGAEAGAVLLTEEACMSTVCKAYRRQVRMLQSNACMS
jgi:tetratricopeptide (TPR) repeat protein